MIQRRHKVGVSPSKGAGVALVVMGVLFLGFGIVLVNLGDTNDGEVLLVRWFFAIIWTAVCLGMVGYGLSAVLRRRPPAMVALSIEETTDGEASSDFDTRLRRLNALRKDGLISQEEYDRKRTEIMGERW